MRVDGTEALERVRKLRREMTEAEKLLWSRLRDRRLGGFKFHRQMWIAPFVADSAWVDQKLVVEVDGSQHGERTEYDEARSQILAKEGYRVIRFWNNEVIVELEAVLTTIRGELLSRVPSPSHSASPNAPLPLPPGEGL